MISADTTTYRNVGTQVKVKPQVTADRSITLDRARRQADAARKTQKSAVAVGPTGVFNLSMVR
jgi:type II secretory pathway component GspD/PulD (secretin)